MQTYHKDAIPPMVEAFGTKHVMYAVGKLDKYNDIMNETIAGGCGADYGFDNHLDALCQSELQGYCRLQRTVVWFEYVKEFFPRHFGFGADNHKLLVVDHLGHNPCGMLQSRPIRTEFGVWLGASDASTAPRKPPEPTPAPSNDAQASRQSSPSTNSPTLAPTQSCASTCTNTSALFNVSITEATGRGMPYWRPSTQPALGEYDEDVTAAIIIQHGDFEYATDFVCYVWNMLRMEFVNETQWGARIHVIAPQFWAQDEQSVEHTVWSAHAHESTLWWQDASAWMDGGASQEFAGNRVSSFSVYDEIIAKLGNMQIYPNMKTVIVAGFSTGGEFVQR